MKTFSHERKLRICQQQTYAKTLAKGTSLKRKTMKENSSKCSKRRGGGERIVGLLISRRVLNKLNEKMTGSFAHHLPYT